MPVAIAPSTPPLPYPVYYWTHSAQRSCVELRVDIIMSESVSAVRRKQYCGLCGQIMFEFYRSPDGHFGLVSGVGAESTSHGYRVKCPTCGAQYRLLDRADITGQTVARV